MKIAVLTLVAAAALAAQSPDCSLVPGWTQDGPARTYVADDLFEYMDGNAEGYLIYGFRKMQGVNCKSGGDTIVFDVSELPDAESAYGIFAANRDPRRAVEKIGMIAQLGNRRAIFAKDKYFVELAGNPASDEALRGFMLAMEKRVPGSTDLPAELSWFPEPGLDQASLRLVPESVLGIRLLKRGYTAQYDYGKAFLVRETSPDAAAAVLTKWRSRLGEAAAAQIGEEAFEATDKYLGRLVVFRKGRYVAGFAGFAEGRDTSAASLLAQRIAAP